MVKHHCNPLYAAGIFVVGGLVGLLSCQEDMVHHVTSVVTSAGFLYLALSVPKKLSRAK